MIWVVLLITIYLLPFISGRFNRFPFDIEFNNNNNDIVNTKGEYHEKPMAVIPRIEKKLLTIRDLFIFAW